jgi:hypothetical protein
MTNWPEYRRFYPMGSLFKMQICFTGSMQQKVFLPGVSENYGFRLPVVKPWGAASL